MFRSLVANILAVEPLDTGESAELEKVLFKGVVKSFEVIVTLGFGE